MLNSNNKAAGVQGTAAATSNGNEIPENQTVTFQVGKDTYTVNHADELLHEFYSWGLNSLHKCISELYISLYELPEPETAKEGTFALQALHDFLNKLEESTTIRKKCISTDEADLLRENREHWHEIQRLKEIVNTLQKKIIK